MFLCEYSIDKIVYRTGVNKSMNGGVLNDKS